MKNANGIFQTSTLVFFPSLALDFLLFFLVASITLVQFVFFLLATSQQIKNIYRWNEKRRIHIFRINCSANNNLYNLHLFSFLFMSTAWRVFAYSESYYEWRCKPLYNDKSNMPVCDALAKKARTEEHWCCCCCWWWWCWWWCCSYLQCGCKIYLSWYECNELMCMANVHTRWTCVCIFKALRPQISKQKLFFPTTHIASACNFFFLYC